ncbi:MAG: 50S ribosomal protein L24 [Patescibacteria group bacterium]
MDFKKGDTVKIIQGKDRGKQGKILQVFPRDGRIVVESLNMASKNVRPKRQGEKGQVVKYNAPFNRSNALLVCPKCNKSTRLNRQKIGDNKERVCKKCKQVIN